MSTADERQLPAIADVLSTMRRKLDLLYDETGLGELNPQTVRDFCVCSGALGDRYANELDFAAALFLAGSDEVPMVEAAIRGLNLQATQVLLTGLFVARGSAPNDGELINLDFRVPLQRITRDLVLLQDYLSV